MSEAVRRESRCLLVVPDFGLGGVAVQVSLWLVPAGTEVAAGERVVEFVAGGTTIDLEAPVSGRLVSWCVEEDDLVTAGTVVAEFEPRE